VYSRCASHIFGDWNACGKVMGLAPWAEPEAQNLQELMSGSLYDGTLSINSELMATLPHVNQWVEDIFSQADDDMDPSDRDKLNMYRNLASQVQSDLERVVLQFLRDLKDTSGACNLVFAGGVALNSTLNGRILRESGFEHVYIPAHPGDEGIAIGCALFGFERHSVSRHVEGGTSSSEARKSPARFSPYLGPFYNVSKIMSALRRHDSWITWDVISNRAGMVEEMVDALCDGQVVALFQGRSEAGPRALGNRSLLADPRCKEMGQRLNYVVKKRESFRPFAPSCLDEFVRDYFGKEECQEGWSPYMSITSGLSKPHLTPAVSHVDGTARVQTLSRDENPFYYDLIQGFHERSGVPMLLNTSFNVAGEPIVESCTDALQTFLASSGIDALVFSDAGVIVRARESSPGNREDDDRTVCLGKMAKNFRSHTTRSSDGEVIRVAISISSSSSMTEEDDELRGDEGGWDDDDDDDGKYDDDDDDDQDQERILGKETGSAVSLDDLYMDDLSSTGERRLDLEDERELGILEALACQDGPITVSQVFRELQQVGMLADEGEEEEDDDEDSLEGDKDNVRDMLERMWARRLVQIAAATAAAAAAAAAVPR
jgi:predicted NodU family carbamoyl transferase